MAIIRSYPDARLAKSIPTLSLQAESASQKEKADFPYESMGLKYSVLARQPRSHL
jgi:hypothetical protein